MLRYMEVLRLLAAFVATPCFEAVKGLVMKVVNAVAK